MAGDKKNDRLPHRERLWGNMPERAILFLFSVFMVVVSLAAAGWLIATGQAGSVDGLFLTLTCLLVALCFALYLKLLIRRAMEAAREAAAPAPAVKAKTPAAAPKPVLAGAEKSE